MSISKRGGGAKWVVWKTRTQTRADMENEGSKSLSYNTPMNYVAFFAKYNN